MTISELNIFATQLGYSESTNDYYNDNGQYWGKYQFGEARRSDISKMLNITTPTRAQFTPQLQETFFLKHIEDIENFISSNGLQKYYGNNVVGKSNGISTKINKFGLIAGAHLGGKTGMKQAVTSGFSYDPHDSNGVYISDYVAKFSSLNVQTIIPGFNLAGFTDNPWLWLLLIGAATVMLSKGKR